MTGKSVSERLQRSIVVYSALAILAISVIVALVSIVPLYNHLKESADRNLLLACNTKTRAVEEYLSRAQDIALQITSRTKAREELESYNKGEVSLDELVGFSKDILTDALKKSKEVAGISRLDQEGNLVIQVGVPIPEALWPIPAEDSREALVRGPVTLDSESSYLVVGAPIINNQSVRVGTDIVLFELERLQQIVQDYTGLGETGETVLGMAHNDQIQLLFPLRKGDVAGSVPRSSLIGLALERALHQETGILRLGEVYNVPEIMAYGPVAGSEWGIVVKMNREELYAPVISQIAPIGSIVLALILLGAFGMGLLIRPLTEGMVALEQESRAKTAALESELTERKRVEEALMKSEQRLRDVLDGLGPYMFVGVMTLEGTLIQANRPVLEIAGLEPEDVLGKPLEETYWWSYSEPVKQKLRDAIRRAANGETCRYDVAVRIGEDHFITIDFCLQPLVDEAGRIVYLIPSAVDITERKRAEKALHEYAERLKTLHAIDRAILAAQSPEAIAQAALQRICQLVPCLHASVTVFDLEANDATVLADHADGENKVGAGAHVPLEAFGITEELQQGKVAVVENILTLSQPTPRDQALQAEGVRSHISVPLVAQDELIGTLNLGSAGPGAFTEEQIEIAREVAGSLAIAIENARLYEEATRRVRELSILYESSKAISQLLAVDEFTQRVIQVMERLLDYGHGAILLIDEQTGELIPFALSDRGKGREFAEKDKEYIRSCDVRVGVGITGWVAQTGQAVCVGDVSQDPRYLEVRPDIRSELCVPLQIGERTIGVMNIETTKPEAYTEHDERLLMTLAGQVAVAIENMRLYEDVKRAAEELEQKVKERTAELETANQELQAANVAMLNLLEDLNTAKSELEKRARLLEEAMQRAQEADRLKTAFLATVSHELRTPLASIKGFASTLLADDVTWDAESQRDFIETIDHEADRLTELIGQLLDMSRLESGTLRIERERCHLADIVTRISERLERLTARHRLVWEVAPALPPLYADPIRIGNVLTNLVENAAKFAPVGTRITIASWTEDDQVVVSVADEGPGVAPEHQARLFERFYRVDNELTRSRPGTGLGLAICKGLVEAHGGRIWMESEPGQGATFFFSLPAA